MTKSDEPKKLTRDERLAEQLRANLRRRKAAAKRQKISTKTDAKMNAKPEQKNTPSSP